VASAEVELTMSMMIPTLAQPIPMRHQALAALT